MLDRKSLGLLLYSSSQVWDGLEMVFTNEILDPETYLFKTRRLLEIVRSRYGGAFSNALIVGCGSGREAEVISDDFGCKVDGIDTNSDQFAACDNSKIRLFAMDASKLEFENASYDLVYSFHAIEHIQNLNKAMSEMRRVLRPNGAYCIGTPNKSRMIGYFGSSTTLYKKVRWNLADLRMRVTGRWENALGAHAGFRREELLNLCLTTFGDAQDVTDEYYLRLYADKIKLINALISLNLSRIAFPAVYAVGRKSTPITSTIEK